MLMMVAVTALAMSVLVPMTMSPAEPVRAHLLQGPILQSGQDLGNSGSLGEEDLNTSSLKLAEGSPPYPPA